MQSIGSSTATQVSGSVAREELKIQSSKLKTPIGLSLVLAIVLVGCGKEGLPLPPEIRVAERTTDLTAFQEGDEAVLRWSYPAMTTSGQNLTDIEEIQVWRAALPPRPGTACTGLAAGPTDAAAAPGGPGRDAEGAWTGRNRNCTTRGSAILLRDDLRAVAADRGETPELFVLWYGVRTVCCRHRESELSNVVRLEPQAPPDPPIDLGLEAGADGIAVRWTPAADTKTLIERSADGAVWTAVTDEPVDGENWRDENAHPGTGLELSSAFGDRASGAAIWWVGKPSQPARIDHPDTYPPGAPSDVVCLPEGTQVRVRWQAVASAGGLQRVPSTRRRIGGHPDR